MDIQKKINEISKLLDELDDYNDRLPKMLNKEEYKIMDLLHLIEFNRFSTSECYRIVREIRNCRIARRKIKDDMELMKVFKNQENRLLNKDYRRFLLSDIGKTVKMLNNREYCYREYKKDEIDEILEVKNG